MFTTGTVSSGDHLARFVWHRDPAITGEPNKNPLPTDTQLREYELSLRGGGGIVEQYRAAPPHPFAHLRRAHEAAPCPRVRQSEPKCAHGQRGLKLVPVEPLYS